MTFANHSCYAFLSLALLLGGCAITRTELDPYTVLRLQRGETAYLKDDVFLARRGTTYVLLKERGDASASLAPRPTFKEFQDGAWDGSHAERSPYVFLRILKAGAPVRLTRVVRESHPETGVTHRLFGKVGVGSAEETEHDVLLAIGTSEDRLLADVAASTSFQLSIGGHPSTGAGPR